MNVQNHQNLIIGGGFGGVYTAKHLLKANQPVTLISEKNYFTFTPLLHEFAAGNLTRNDITFEYESFFKNKHFNFIRATTTNINFENQEITTKHHKHTYQNLILATGAKTNYFNIKGKEHLLTLKTIADAANIKRSIIAYAQGEHKHVDLTVIGAGATGVELILELEGFLAQIKKRSPELNYTLRLVHSREHILNQFAASVSRHAESILKKKNITLTLNSRAEEITQTTIKTTTGEYPSNITILAGGITPRTNCIPSDLSKTKGYICVNDFLQITPHQNVYAIGDITTSPQGPIPSLAQVATHQAEIITHNIIAAKQNKPLKPYKLNLKGMMLSLGYGQGAGVIKGIPIKGFPAWWIWRTIYLLKTPGLMNKLRVAFSWTIDLFQGKNLTEE